MLVAAALILGAVALTRPAGAAASSTWFVRVAGGGDCSQANPCGSIDAAYQRAGAGDAILMAAGSYGPQIVNYRAAADGFAANVVVQPQGGAVSLAWLSIHGPHLTVRRVSIMGFTEIVSTPGGNANFGLIDNVDSADQIYVSGSDNVSVVNSRIHPGINSVAIGISPYNTGTHVPTNTLIENNEVGPAWASSDWRALGLHNETVHVLGAANLTIRRNLIWEGGTSSSLQIDTSLGSLSGIVVENNYIAGCGLRTPPDGAACAAYYGVGYSNYPGASPSEILIRNNTIRGSIIDYGYNKNSSSGIASGNLVDGAVGCSGATMYGNLLGAGSFHDCSLNTIGNALFTLPAFGGVTWGSITGLLGQGHGVPLGSGFSLGPIIPTPTATTTVPTTSTTVHTTTVPPNSTTTVAPSTTTSVAGPPGSFGAAAPGSMRCYLTAGYKLGSIYALRQSASLVAFRFYAQGGTAGQKFTPVIYRVNASDQPTTLAAQGAEVTVAAHTPAGLVSSALPAVTLSPGRYLLALMVGPTSVDASVFYTPETNAGVWNANAYGSPSSSWGPANLENNRWSVRVDYR